MKRNEHTVKQMFRFCVALFVVSGLPVFAQIKVNYLTHGFAPAITINEDLIAKFEAENPDIDVVYEAEPNSDYEQSLFTALASGAGPDVFWAGDWLVPQFLKNGVLAPLDPTAYGVGTTEEFVTQFGETALAAYTRDGQIYTGGISEYNTFSIFYNVDQFTEAGLALPSATEPMTWEAFADIAEKLAKPAEGQVRERNAVGFFFVPIWSVLVLEPMVRQLGGELVDAQGNVTLDTPEMASVMGYLRELRFDRAAFDPAFQVNPLDDFAAGRISTMIAGPWAISIIRQTNPELNFAVMPMPVFEGGERVTTLYSWAWYVNARSDAEKQAAAWKFINFLSQNAKAWWDGAAYLQPRNVMADDSTSIADYRSTSEPLLRDFEGDFAAGQYQFRSEKYYEIANILMRAQTRVLEGEEIAQVLKDAQAEAQ